MLGSLSPVVQFPILNDTPLLPLPVCHALRGLLTVWLLKLCSGRQGSSINCWYLPWRYNPGSHWQDSRWTGESLLVLYFHWPPLSQDRHAIFSSWKYYVTSQNLTVYRRNTTELSCEVATKSLLSKPLIKNNAKFYFL